MTDLTLNLDDKLVKWMVLTCRGRINLMVLTASSSVQSPGQLGRREGYPLPVFSAGGHCEQRGMG